MVIIITDLIPNLLIILSQNQFYIISIVCLVIMVIWQYYCNSFLLLGWIFWVFDFIGKWDLKSLLWKSPWLLQYFLYILNVLHDFSRFYLTFPKKTHSSRFSRFSRSCMNPVLIDFTTLDSLLSDPVFQKRIFHFCFFVCHVWETRKHCPWKFSGSIYGILKSNKTMTNTIKGHMSKVHGVFLITQYIISPVDLQKKKNNTLGTFSRIHVL